MRSREGAARCWILACLLAGAMLLVIPAIQAQAESGGVWPGMGGNADRSNTVGEAEGGTGLVHWVGPPTEHPRLAPIVVDERVFTAPGTRVLAMDADSGDALWNRSVGTEIAGIAAGQGRLYVASAERNVADDGWSGSAEGSLQAIDQGTGALVWQVTLPGGVGGAPVLHGDHILVGARDGYLRALAVEDGTPAWTVRLGSTVGSPVVVDGTVYVDLPREHLFALDAAAGEERWRSDITPLSPVAVSEGRVILLVPAGQPSGIDVVALSTQDGSELWRTDGPETIGHPLGAPAVAGQRVLFPDTEGVVVLDAATGAEQARLLEEVRFPVGIAATASTAFVAGTDGSLRALELATGQARWVHPPGPGFGATAPTVVEGRLFVDRAGAGALAVDAGAGPPAEAGAGIEARDLTVGPVAWEPGQPVAVTVELENTGSAHDSVQVSVDVDGTPHGRFVALLGPGEKRSFPVDPVLASADPRTVAVTLGGEDMGLEAQIVLGASPPADPSGDRPAPIPWPDGPGFWEATVPGRVYETLLTGDLAIVPFDAYERSGVVAYEASTGQEAWRYELPEGYSVPGIARSGSLVLVTHGAGITGLDLETGKPAWTRTAAWWSPRILEAGGGMVWIEPGQASTVSALDATSGAPVWSTSAEISSFDPAPIISEGLVLFVNASDHAVALDARSGEERWRVQLLPDRADIRGMVTTRELGIVHHGGNLTAIDLATGETRWRHGGPLGPGLDVLTQGEHILVTDARNVSALDPATGEPTWSVATEGVEQLVQVTDNDRVLVHTWPGRVVALAVADGATLWQALDPSDDARILEGSGDHVLVTSGSHVTALDPSTGDVVWQIEHVDTWIRAASGQGAVAAFIAPGENATLTVVNGSTPQATVLSHLEVPADTIEVGEPIHLTIEARTSAGPGRALVVEVTIDGRTVDREELVLPGSTTRTLDLGPIRFDDPGRHQVEVRVVNGSDDPGLSRSIEVAPAQDTAPLGVPGARLWTTEWSTAFVEDLFALPGSEDVLLTDVDDQLTRLDGTNGEPLWTAEGNQRWHPPVPLKDAIVAMGEGNQLLGLDPDTGTPLWRLADDRSPDHRPSAVHATAGAGSIVVLASSETVHAIDARTGATVWERHVRLGGSTGVSVTDGQVLVTGLAGPASRMLALDLDNGQLRWDRELGVYDPAVAGTAGGVVAVLGEPAPRVNGSRPVALIGLDAASGEQLWVQEVPGAHPRAGPWVTQDRILHLEDGHLVGRDPSTGEAVFRHPLSAARPTPVAVSGLVVYVAGADQEVQALRAADGHLLGSAGILPESLAVLTVAGDRLVLLDPMEDRVHAYDLTGEIEPAPTPLGPNLALIVAVGVAVLGHRRRKPVGEDGSG